MSDEQQPELDPTLFGNRRVITIMWDVDEDTVVANWAGCNRFEAIGILTEALDVIKTEGIAYYPEDNTEETDQ